MVGTCTYNQHDFILPLESLSHACIKYVLALNPNNQILFEIHALIKQLTIDKMTPTLDIAAHVPPLVWQLLKKVE